MSTQKKVLYFIDTLERGGGQRQLFYVLQYMDRTQITPLVLIIQDTDDRYYTDAIASLDIPVLRLHHGHGLMGRLDALRRYLSLMWHHRPQVVHSFSHYSNLISRVMRPFCPPHRLVTTSLSVYNDRQFRSESLTAFLDDIWMTNNPTELERVRQAGIRRPTNSTFIANGVPMAHFADAEATALKQQAFFAGAELIIGVIARIERVKNQIVILQALRSLHDELPPGFRLFNLGIITDENLHRDLEAEIINAELENVVKLLPATDDVAPYYALADITLLPSLWEGFPNVMLESLAAGKPVLISEEANQSGVIEHGINGWVFPAQDVQALSNCLRQVWTLRPEVYQHMAENSRQTARAYRVEAMVEQYIALYTPAENATSGREDP